MKRGKIYIGTSGWHYKHWKEIFYPTGLSEAMQFEYYATQFNTVEINNSFYMLPAPQTFTGWRKESPPGFLFSVKASRYITHMKKLMRDAESIRRFFSHAGKLKEKMGPVLFQLPPHWKLNLQRLQDFIGHLPKGYRYTFEFRNDTWYTDAVYDVLRKANCAFCIYELAHQLTPVEVTANFVYVRLHGPGEKYQGKYSNPQLKKWATRCKAWRVAGKDVYVYFDNDQAGYAAMNAATLLKMTADKKTKK